MRALTILPISILLSVWASLSLAQVTPPATAPTAPAGAPWYDAYSWWWIILVIIVVAAVIWWFTRGRGTRL